MRNLESMPAQRNNFAHAHAAHHIKLVALVLAMCGSRCDDKDSTNEKHKGSCAVERGACNVSMFHKNTDGGQDRQGKELCTFLTNCFAVAYPPGPSPAVVIQTCHTD